MGNGKEGKKEKRKINGEIGKEKWKEYFMGLLGGVEGKVVRGSENRREGRGEKEIGLEEVRKSIKGLKDKKAMEIDEIPNEVWKYGGEEIEK